MMGYGKPWMYLSNAKIRWFRVLNYRSGGCHFHGVIVPIYNRPTGGEGGFSQLNTTRSLSSLTEVANTPWTCNVTSLTHMFSGHCPRPTSGCPLGLLVPDSRARSLIITRGKKSKRSGTGQKTDHDDESTDEEDEEDWKEESGLGYKDIRARVPSLRLDSILKSGLNMSRNKVESAFYDSKIRVNEKKILKKSKQLEEGDEIDVIKGISSSNPDLINVARVVIIKVGSYDEDSDKRTVKLRRYQDLLIRKYEDSKYDED